MNTTLRNAFLALWMVCACTWVHAQSTNVIQGTVKDKSGEAVIGAAVAVKGTSLGTVTDIDGKFSIAVPSTAISLVIKYIGYKTVEVPISGGNFNVVLQDDILGLGEVVVTAQAIQREKQSLGYAVTTVNSTELNNSAPTSAVDALQGKVAGIQIDNSSGTIGGSTRVVLRGGSSLTGDNNALIVVDGVPIDNSNFGFILTGNGSQGDVMNNGFDPGSRVNDINPEDIQSVTVLNGAAAVTLYGQRGANGAILYTTKTGTGTANSTKKLKVTLSEYIQAESVLKLPTNQNQFGQGSEDNFGNPYFDTRQNWSWGPALNGQTVFWGSPIGNTIQVKPYSAQPNNYNQFFNTGATYNSNVAIEGGGNGTTFYTSFNNVKYDGIVPTTGYERNSLRLNVSHDFGDYLTIGGSFNYVNTNSVLPTNAQQNNGVWFTILNTPRDIPTVALQNLNNPFNSVEHFYDLFYVNPYWLEQNQKNIDNVDRFLSRMNVDWRPLKWLTLSGRVGADIYTDTRQQEWAAYSFTPVQYYQPFFPAPGESVPYPVTSQGTPNGKYSIDQYVVENINADFMAKFSKEFKHDFNFDALLGYNIFSNELHNVYNESNGLVIPTLYTLSNTKGQSTTNSEIINNRLLGEYADVNLGWKHMLFLELTVRNDNSSTLPIDHRSYTYPGAGASWVFTEVGKKKIDPWILSYGKLRANISQIGRDAPAYSLNSYFVPGYASDLYVNTQIKFPPGYISPAGTVPGYQLTNVLEDPNLKPEISTSWEVGGEFAFLKDRVNVNVTYYNKLTKNQIVIIPIAPSTGYSAQVINAGELRNNGVELAIRIIPVNTKWGFKWEVYGTWTKNVSDVLSVSSTANQIVIGGSGSAFGAEIVEQVGHPLGSFYGEGVETENGHVVVNPATGIPLQSPTPGVLGNYQPTWLGSIGTTISWKGLTLNVLFGGQNGGQFYSNTAELQYFLGSDVATAYNNRVPFVVPNSVYLGSDNQYHANTTKVAPFNYWYEVSSIPSYEMITASFIKLREISLTYALPAKVFSKAKYITGVSVKAYGSNLWLWTPKSNTFADPELSSGGASNLTGYEFYVLPSVRNYGGGATVTF